MIIISIMRSKAIALLLGPTGIGVAGLLTATTGLVAGLTNFGLGINAIREIAAANETDEEDTVAKTITVFRRLVWMTGSLGMILTIIFSKYLSELTFGNSDYTYGFIFLSVTLLLNQLISGQDALLQGMRKLKALAKANVFGSLLSLLISVPIFYYYKLDGIIPGLIISAGCLLLVTWCFAKDIHVKAVALTLSETLANGKGMLKLGFFLSISGLIGLGASYIVRIYITKIGGIADVGLYNAGFAIISTYVGLVFTAMGTDYYPRLSGVSTDNKKAAILINQQAEIAILILAPILCGFLIYIDWVVIILYSKEFIGVNGMIHYAALGMIFKAVSWAIGFIVLAKGSSNAFFWNELIANSYQLVFNLIGYKIMGLDGLGMSFIAGYLVYLLQIFWFARHYYSFYFEKGFFKVFFIQFTMLCSCFAIITTIAAPYNYVVGTLVIIGSSMFTFKEMDKRIGFANIIENFKNRNNSK